MLSHTCLCKCVHNICTYIDAACRTLLFIFARIKTVRVPLRVRCEKHFCCYECAHISTRPDEAPATRKKTTIFIPGSLCAFALRATASEAATAHDGKNVIIKVKRATLELGTLFSSCFRVCVCVFVFHPAERLCAGSSVQRFLARPPGLT